MKIRFQSLPFKCNLQRYTVEFGVVREEVGGSNPGGGGGGEYRAFGAGILSSVAVGGCTS